MNDGSRLCCVVVSLTPRHHRHTRNQKLYDHSIKKEQKNKKEKSKRSVHKESKHTMNKL